jgi:hypothetical protein
MLKKEPNCLKKACPGCPACTRSYEEITAGQADISRIYQRITAGGPESALSDSGITSLSKENFNSYRAKINASIEKRFGAQDHKRLLIASQGRRPASGTACTWTRPGSPSPVAGNVAGSK